MQEIKSQSGICPYYIAIPDRIYGLAEAIWKHTGEDPVNTEKIKEWAREIILSCEVIEAMDRKARETEKGCN